MVQEIRLLAEWVCPLHVVYIVQHDRKLVVYRTIYVPTLDELVAQLLAGEKDENIVRYPVAAQHEHQHARGCSLTCRNRRTPVTASRHGTAPAA